MKMHRLTTAQWLPISIEEAWTFFSMPENLDLITPDDMSFNILSGSGERTYAGQVITYKIAPVLNIPMSWVTEITQCVDKHYFIDEQRFGPYKFWHHLHRFKEQDGGVLMEDILHYALPGGALGELFGGPMIHKKVKGIFDYRGKKLAEVFPGAKDPFTPSLRRSA
ncbi:MAG: SRPBCC family protein [Flavobacteriales bacterium]|nr:SRPBCC family protein [Flavobacteriales bacterium]